MNRGLLIILLTLIPMIDAFAEELVIYSGRSDKFVKPVVAEFTKQTGIKVTLHSAESTALLNKLKLEGDRTEADLFISNDAGNLQRGSDFGLFAAIPEKVGAPIPQNFKAADNTWLGVSARARVLVRNTKNDAAKNVSSVFDLAKPELKNKIAITNSSNGSFIAGVTVYMEQAGKGKTLDWMKGMADNAGRNVYNKHSKVVKAVAKGKAAVGLVNHYYIYRHLADDANAPIEIVLPDQNDGMGIAWNVAGVAVSKHSKKQDAAFKFVAFVASKAGQKIFAEVNKEYPTRTDVEAHQDVPKLAGLKIADVPMGKLGTMRNETVDLIEKSGLQ